MALVTVVEATHNITTKNLNTYQAEYFPASVKSWRRPYQKPVLLNHNSYSGKPAGRVKKGQVVPSEIKKNLQTQRLFLNITDPDVAAGILDGTYTTLSIGGSAKSAVCSICNTDILDAGWCGHLKGRKYDGKVCTWLIGPMEYEEVSFVNVPADPYAQVLIPDLETAAKEQGESVELARQLLKEYLSENDERRTEGVAKTAAELATEVQEQINSLTSQTGKENDNPNTGQTEGTQTQTSPEGDVVANLTKVVESLTSAIGQIKDENKPSEEVFTKITGTLESIAKVLSGEMKVDDFMATFQSNNEQVQQLETKLTDAETKLAAATADIADLKDKLAKAKKESEPLKQQVEQSQKLAQSVAKLARMVALDRVVDLTIVVEGKSPNDRDSIAASLAGKQLSDLVAEGQALAEKLPIQQRPQGTAEKEGAGGETQTETPGGSQENKDVDAAKVVETMISMFSGRKPTNK